MCQASITFALIRHITLFSIFFLNCKTENCNAQVIFVFVFFVIIFFSFKTILMLLQSTLAQGYIQRTQYHPVGASATQNRKHQVTIGGSKTSHKTKHCRF